MRFTSTQHTLQQHMSLWTDVVLRPFLPAMLQISIVFVIVTVAVMKQKLPQFSQSGREVLQLVVEMDVLLY